MQITLTAGSPAETRLLAAFLNDLADLQELQPRHAPALTTAPTQAEATEAITPPKKPRPKKNEPAAETPPAETPATETPDEPAPGNESVTTAEPAAGSGSAETAEPAKIDHDVLRVLFGELAQLNKREDAVKIVRSYGYNGIKDIAVDKLVEVHAKLVALKA